MSSLFFPSIFLPFIILLEYIFTEEHGEINNWIFWKVERWNLIRFLRSRMNCSYFKDTIQVISFLVDLFHRFIRLDIIIIIIIRERKNLR